MVLPDGSIAWLNVQSVLKYPDQFTGNKRIVTVEKGEVFFDDRHDAARPFTVSTGSVVTTVLGTSFLVKQTYEKDIIEVSVKTGKGKSGKIQPARSFGACWPGSAARRPLEFRYNCK